MLILIAGITGMCGQPCARAALSSGHQVRGMGRNPDKLHKETRSKLESFVQIKGTFDVEGVDQAVKGVDAIICAYNNMPKLIVAGQLALLYAAERAGVKASPCLYIRRNSICVGSLTADKTDFSCCVLDLRLDQVRAWRPRKLRCIHSIQTYR